jgi:small subunit ribosomal protein S1
LADNVEGYLRAAEIQRDRVEDARTFLKEGEEIEAKFVGVDKKTKSISLSIKAKDVEEESNAIKDYSSQNAGTATLGDIFKQMDK